MKLSERVKWAAVGLFVTFFFAWALMREQNSETGGFMGGLAVMSLGVFMLSKGWIAREEGKIEIRRLRYNRADRPRGFAIAVGATFLTGALAVLFALGYLLADPAAVEIRGR